MDMPEIREDRSGRSILSFRTRKEKIKHQINLPPYLHESLVSFANAHNISQSLVIASALVTYFNAFAESHPEAVVEAPEANV